MTCLNLSIEHLHCLPIISIRAMGLEACILSLLLQSPSLSHPNKHAALCYHVHLYCPRTRRLHSLGTILLSTYIKKLVWITTSGAIVPRLTFYRTFNPVDICIATSSLEVNSILAGINISNDLLSMFFY